jgi:hypothetical protein
MEELDRKAAFLRRAGQERFGVVNKVAQVRKSYLFHKRAFKFI